MQQYTLSVKLLPLRRDACKCHCPRGAHIFTQQDGLAVSSGSDLRGNDLSASCLGLFILSLFYSVSLSCFCISYSSPSIILIHCLSPPASLLCTLLFILTSYSALLCHCYHGYSLLRMRWGGKRTDGRYRGLRYSCHSSLSSLSPLLKCYLFQVFN